MPIFKRKERDGVLINLTDHSVQLARLPRFDRRPQVMESLVELPAGDTAAAARWLDENFKDRGGSYLPAFCGFHPADRILEHETVNGRRMGERDYVPGLFAQRVKTATADAWEFAVLDAARGLPLAADNSLHPALLFGVPYSEIRETQERLRRLGIRPRRLELGTLALLGGLSQYQALTGFPHLVAACEIARTQTRLFILGKDGVHTPLSLPHGLLSVDEAAMKAFGTPDVAAARRRLEEPNEEVTSHSRRLVRILSRHLRPAIDYFEMQTGQRVGALFSAHLPSRLGWLEQALAAAVDLEYLTPDLGAWLPVAGLQVDGAQSLGPSWFQALCVVAQLAPAQGAPPDAKNP